MGGEAIDSFPTRSAELYDIGLGFSASRQPRIASVSFSDSGGLTVSGAGFRGGSEGSSGTTQDSPADYPVVRLMSLAGSQPFFLLATNWTEDSVICAPVSSLPPGNLLATVFVNGIPSAGQIFISPTIPPVAFNPAGNLMAPSIRPGRVTLSFAGMPGLTYNVQRAPTPTGPWRNIATITIGDSGIGNNQDTNPPAAKAFYRTTHQ